MTINLLPCPLCGNKAEFVRKGTSNQSCQVKCTECGCWHESADEYDSSGTSWNNRDHLTDTITNAVDEAMRKGNCSTYDELQTVISEALRRPIS